MFGAAYFTELADVISNAGGPPDPQGIMAVMRRHGLSPRTVGLSGPPARGQPQHRDGRVRRDAYFNLARSAEALRVHPNRVLYRLDRIRELAGRDPRDPDDVILLALGLRYADANG